jgi:hypothetical protein
VADAVDNAYLFELLVYQIFRPSLESLPGQTRGLPIREFNRSHSRFSPHPHLHLHPNRHAEVDFPQRVW